VTGDLAIGLDELRRREFRRTLGISATAHLVAVAIALASPMLRPTYSPPAVMTVDLVTLPSAAAPAPAAPAAPRPKPKPKTVVLPTKPSLAKPKPKPKPEKRREVVLEPKPKKEESLDDLMAELREKAGEPEPHPAPEAPPRTASVPAPGGGAGRPVSPEVLDWVRRAKLAVRRAWVVPPGFRTEALETRVVVTLDAAGNVVGEPRIERRSGNPWYDEGVVRGIQKASPLPPPPQPGDWDFIFVPEDSY
jgi:periplasmic protein TonB